MTATEWPMRVESGLAAHFKEPDGRSRPGVLWLIGLLHGGGTYHVRVKALLADDATRATRKNDRYQAETAMQYLAAQLNAGWHPSQEREHVIHISNPLSSNGTSAAVKPWWRFW